MSPPPVGPSGTAERGTAPISAVESMVGGRVVGAAGTAGINAVAAGSAVRPGTGGRRRCPARVGRDTACDPGGIERGRRVGARVGGVGRTGGGRRVSVCREVEGRPGRQRHRACPGRSGCRRGQRAEPGPGWSRPAGRERRRGAGRTLRGCLARGRGCPATAAERRHPGGPGCGWGRRYAEAPAWPAGATPGPRGQHRLGPVAGRGRPTGAGSGRSTLGRKAVGSSV